MTAARADDPVAGATRTSAASAPPRVEVPGARSSVDIARLGPAKGLTGWEGELEPSFSWEKTPHAPPRISWWPMFNWGVPGIGNPRENHWAAGGCLDKYDRVYDAGARAWQEENRSRGYDDALKSAFGIDGEWDAFNAGHCNQEAMREAWFVDPVQSVYRPLQGNARSRLHSFRNFPVFGGLAEALSPMTRDIFPEESVEFTPHDIRGLKTLCMDLLLDTTQGNGGISFVGYRFTRARPGLAESAPQRDPEEPYPHEVIEDVCKRWGRGQSLAIIVDRHPGETLDNRAYDGGSVEQLRDPPDGFDASQVPAGGEVKFYAIRFVVHEQHEDDIHLTAWVHKKKERGLDGGEKTIVKSGWIHTKPGFFDKLLRGKKESEQPDFYWLPHVDPDILKGAPWVGFSTTNPKVNAFEVWRLYQDSIGGNWRALAAQYRSRFDQHLDILRQRGLDTSYLERQVPKP